MNVKKVMLVALVLVLVSAARQTSADGAVPPGEWCNDADLCPSPQAPCRPCGMQGMFEKERRNSENGAVGEEEGVGSSGSGSADASTVELLQCKPGGETKGMFFPAFANENYTWSVPLRGVLYFVGLMYCFVGVSLFADTFMCAIEEITSKKQIVTDKDTGAQTTVHFWNPTVANLTLMALGSSAPEILLSVIEVLNEGFMAGALGPSTIVGSAAFNLLVILAICTASLTAYKGIERHTVYLITAFASLFAYVWLVIVLMVISPDVVEWWEATITVACFPVLVVVAWVVDAQVCCGKKVAGKKLGPDAGYVVDIENTSGAVIKVGKYEDRQVQSMVNEIVETRLDSAVSSKGVDGFGFGLQEGEEPALQKDTVLTKEQKKAIVANIENNHAAGGQSRAVYRAMASRKMMGKKVQSERTGGASLAEAIWEADDPSELPERPSINVADASAKGYITFARQSVRLLEGGNQDKTGIPRSEKGNVWAHIAVHRVQAGSLAEKTEVSYKTVSGTAAEDKDYVGIPDGKLVFEPGDTQHIIKVEIIDDDEYEEDEDFTVEITAIDGVDSSSFADSGLPQDMVCTCTILNDDTVTSFAERVTALIGFNQHKFLLGKEAWADQIKDALLPPSGEGAIAHILWVIVWPWSLFNCLSPPTTLLGGFGTFVYSLGCVGMTTAMIADFANLFGCIVGLKNEVTAITFVALGTSLPDAFASRTAAQQEPNADAAITNVTGSNSVNVFLGLGITWLIASVYWTVNGPNDVWREKVPLEIQAMYPDGVFYVKAGSLGFSVIIFSCVSIVAFVWLHIQRLSGGELGGPRRWYMATGFCVLWMLYIVLSSMKSYNHIGDIF